MRCVLTGGSAATFYTDEYRSRDIDFVVTFGGAEAQGEAALHGLGFFRTGHHYAHNESAFTVDFPPGPLSVGSDVIKRWDTFQKGRLVLNVLNRTDCVRDRLAGFFHWNDRGNLRVAVLVAKSGPVDYDLIREWSFRENAAQKFEEFIKALERTK